MRAGQIWVQGPLVSSGVANASLYTLLMLQNVVIFMHLKYMYMLSLYVCTACHCKRHPTMGIKLLSLPWCHYLNKSSFLKIVNSQKFALTFNACTNSNARNKILAILFAQTRHQISDCRYAVDRFSEMGTVSHETTKLKSLKITLDEVKWKFGWRRFKVPQKAASLFATLERWSVKEKAVNEMSMKDLRNDIGWQDQSHAQSMSPFLFTRIVLV